MTDKKKANLNDIEMLYKNKSNKSIKSNKSNKSREEQDEGKKKQTQEGGKKKEDKKRVQSGGCGCANIVLPH